MDTPSGTAVRAAGWCTGRRLDAYPCNGHLGCCVSTPGGARCQTKCLSMFHDINLLQHAAVDIAIGDDVAIFVARESLHPGLEGDISHCPDNRNVSHIVLQYFLGLAIE